MQRRHLLGAAAAALCTPLARSARADMGAWHRPAPFGNDPALAPLRGLQGQDLACDAAAVEGRWPEGLRGTLYRNGPGLFERAGRRYQHWFDGDGLVQAWRFDGAGGVSHRARFVRTTKFKAEQAAGEFLVPAFGTAIAPKRPVRSADDLNVANTSVLPLPDRLLALWEGGSAYALDSGTLDTRGPVAWAPDLAGLPFSAHPKVEPDGTIWNFGTAFMGGGSKLVLYQLSPAGALQRHTVLEMPACAMVHDFAITRRYLAFLLPPLTLDLAALRAGESMAGAMRWQDDGATRLLVVDKGDFSQRVFELPAAMVFHFANGWDDGDMLVLDFVRSIEAPSFNARAGSIVQGEFRGAAGSQPALLRLDMQSGRHTLDLGEDRLEFPRVDPRVVAQRHRYAWFPAVLGRDGPARFGHDGLLRLDRESGARDAFRFGDDVVVEEHVFVPRPGSHREGDGWLVGAGYDLRWRESFASVFDAGHLADGPLAVARLPYAVPHAFHGQFVAAT